MNKLLVICGPTATGKTNLALYLAKQLDGELLSADSRQVYKGMDIGTGKDLPKNAKWQMLNAKLVQGAGFYLVKDVRVWGYDLVTPKREFSVAQYTKIAMKIINNIWKRGKLPILVGGTGLYIKSVVDGIPTASIPKNRKLRINLEGRSIDEMFEQLAQMDPVKAASLNISDRKNPRRLIRAVEIAQFNLTKRKKKELVIKGIKDKADVLFIGLTLRKKDLEKRIKKRVAERMYAGMEAEVRNLLKNNVKWESQAMNALGYRQFRKYYEGKISKKEYLNTWVVGELKYAKRQKTWFSKDKRVVWFDVDDAKCQKEVEKMAKEWHNRNIKDKISNN